MNRKVFHILLIPAYLLVAIFVMFLLLGFTNQLNVFFYLILVLFVPCSYLISLTKQYRLNRLGTIGYLCLGVFLAGSQPFDFQFQDMNAWLLLGGMTIVLGIIASVHQYKR